jgi:SM-20-related protein
LSIVEGQSSRQGQASIIDRAALETIAAGLLRVGWAVIDDAVSPAIVDSLRADLVTLDDEAFAQAGVGRGDDWQRTDEVRQDRVHWLDPESDASQWYFRWVDSLRFGLNRSLLLGLFDYECHLAWYPPGAFYLAHVDAFRGDDNRKVSTVLYLNNDWQPADGGELVLYEPVAAEADFDPTAPRTVKRIANPTSGTLVCFLSEEIPHEVLDAVTDRFSIAGWYRVNGNGRQPDPPVFPLSA